MRFPWRSGVMFVAVTGLLALGGGTSPVRAQDAPVVKTAKKSGVGRYLTDSEGRALYMFTSDGTGESACNKQCASDWPPYIVASGKPTTTSDAVDAEDLGTIQRQDGLTQVTYLGHPLYYFSEDKGSGTTKGEDAQSFGGTWYLVGLSGQRLVERR